MLKQQLVLNENYEELLLTVKIKLIVVYTNVVYLLG